MPQYIAFLRGINLGRRRLTMDHLRPLFEELKFSDVGTFIASGNVLFESKCRDGTLLEKKIEQHLRQALGYEVETFIRTRAEIAAITAFRPFVATDRDPPGATVHVAFLRETLSQSVSQRLLACRTDVDEFSVRGRELFWRCRVRITESTVWSSPMMKALSLPSSTMRNMNTIQKLAAKYPSA